MRDRYPNIAQANLYFYASVLSKVRKDVQSTTVHSVLKGPKAMSGSQGWGLRMYVYF